ncbi:hypothetical protein ACFXP7_07795 [Microbacterium sp. P06]|uniref:hypothetical protein n=1 Tax=unclassified Microbacterium TaxID=2609290 RepID=UPI003746794E
MTDRKGSDDAAKRATTNEGEYTDIETEDGRDSHKNDVVPGEYTDTDLGEDSSR